jgi:hypothetical protein
MLNGAVEMKRELSRAPPSDGPEFVTPAASGTGFSRFAGRCDRAGNGGRPWW